MEKKIKNRRRGPDQLSKLISFIITISWVLIFVLFIIWALAMPRKEMSIVAIISQNTQSAGSWDISLAEILLPVLVIQLALCIFGLLLSSRRMKRKRDQYSRSLIFFTITSIAGLIAYIIKFA